MSVLEVSLFQDFLSFRLVILNFNFKSASFRYQFSSVQLWFTFKSASLRYQCSSVQLCVTLCNPMVCSTPGLPVHYQLLEFAQTHIHWAGDAIQPYHPLSYPSPPAFNLSQHQGLFQGVSSSHQVAKVLEFSFSISPSNEYSGLISFRMDWSDLLAVQGIEAWKRKASLL